MGDRPARRGGRGLLDPLAGTAARRTVDLPALAGVVAMVVAVVGAVGSLVEVVLIGHSGAAAAWSGVRLIGGGILNRCEIRRRTP